MRKIHLNHRIRWILPGICGPNPRDPGLEALEQLAWAENLRAAGQKGLRRPFWQTYFCGDVDGAETTYITSYISNCHPSSQQLW